MGEMKVREIMERVQHEDAEWRQARLHFGIHGNWLGRDECSTCLGVTYPDSPYLRLTPWARDHLTLPDFEALAIRAQELEARVGAFYSPRGSRWVVSADTPRKRVYLRASGPLAAVLAGVLDDLEAAPDDPAVDDDPEPVDLNPEGDPARNGAFG